MSDPYAVIVAALVAVGGAVQGANLPDPIKDQVADSVQVAEQAAPQVASQVNQILSSLPEPAQQFAQKSIDDAAAALPPVVQAEAPPPSVEVAPPEVRRDESAADPVVGSNGQQNDMLNAAQLYDSPIESHPPIPSAIAGLNSVVIGAFPIFRPWLNKAGQLCDGIKPETIAALYSAENNFRYGPSAPVSISGAKGPGQFMDATWAKYGKDADGDGKADVLGVADSVMATGHLLCDLYAQVDQWKARGIVTGDSLDLAIAGYNAGAGAVLQSRGMPSGSPDYENQTKPYVRKIRGSEEYFRRMLSPFSGLPLSGLGGQIVDRATTFLGLPYVWGGGDIDGPSGGGFDCSGLTSYAVHAATSGKVTLPRTSETQWNIGVEIPLEQAVAGDLLFGNWGPAGPGHVAIYVGNGQMIHAPTTGDVVRIGPVFDNMKARRVI
ncbi:NlpC/P60 family protein [Rhodococcus sp. NM-2]|jgi:hypothetical protein|uniref:C40 family peptidase n=1 Tax=Rhodococcus sp. NM-2 TaxID=3401174 RepID=UPI003AAA8D94